MNSTSSITLLNPSQKAIPETRSAQSRIGIFHIAPNNRKGADTVMTGIIDWNHGQKSVLEDLSQDIWKAFDSLFSD